MTANQPTSLSREAAIRIEGLTKRFGTLTAVDHLTLKVLPGEAFALVGPDAAGKTTTMRMLVGIMDPDEGRAEVLGFDTVREAEPLKEHIGYMPQRFGLYDDLTVVENMVFYADIYRVPREERDQRMPELLGFSNLTPFQDRLARNLSGGMRQKLGLACALIHRPRLLFLDEPTFGVDPISRREFWEILYRLLGTGLTIFLSTAYMDEAERAHRVGLMHHGKLLVVDTPKAIKSSFKGELLEVRASNLWVGPQGSEPPSPGARLPGHGGPVDDDGGYRRHGDGAHQGGLGAGRFDRRGHRAGPPHPGGALRPDRPAGRGVRGEGKKRGEKAKRAKGKG